MRSDSVCRGGGVRMDGGCGGQDASMQFGIRFAVSGNIYK